VNKQITFVVTIALFIVQAFFIAGTLQAEVYPPNPLTEIHADKGNVAFREACNIICMALSLYKSDAFQRLPKEELIKMYGIALPDSVVRFDLENLDVLKKGWTRYYPFSIDGKGFVARIFLTKENYFQPELPVISEMVVEKLGVTLQILPDINEILDDCRIKPNKIYKPSMVEKSA